MNPNSPHAHLRWLFESEAGSKDVDTTMGDLEAQPFPFPPEIGWGHFEALQLPFDCSFFRGVHHFQPVASGRLVPLGEFEVDCKQPTFIIQTIRGGRVCQQELIPALSLIIEDGKDLFGHIERRHAFPWVDGTSDSEMVSLCMGVSTLESFLGPPEAERLLSMLGLEAHPNFVVRAMPKSLGALLHTAMSKQFTGQARKLFAQAKALEYLAGLSEHLHGGGLHQPFLPREKDQVRALHAHLLSLDGKVPALETLAQQFQVPARRLNDEFTLEFGESIYTFITGHRLDQAKEVLLRTDIPMKVLAGRLGYSHVNNFINAFNRRFGCPPGRFRKERQQGPGVPDQ